MAIPAKPAPSADAAKRYEPAPSERTVIDAYLAARCAKAKRPHVKVKMTGGIVAIEPVHPDNPTAHILLAQALGTVDTEFYHHLLVQIANASGKGPTPDQATLNFNLAVIEGIGPRDQVEAMLAAQMAAVHNATMAFARRLEQVSNIQQQDGAERAFNKLARTFAVQMEALKRYRTGGEQKVTVQHVTVNEGGQAIVGTVSASAAGGGGGEKQAATP